jgi:hypothetical protein
MARVPPGADDQVYVPPGFQLREPVYNEDGVDLTQVRWMLDRTPTERLRALKQLTDSIERLVARAEAAWTPKRS